MPKRPLYARCTRLAWLVTLVALLAKLVALVALLAAGMGVRLQAQEDGRAAPCAACIAFVASPGQTVLLPETLNDLEVVLRIAGSRARGPADSGARARGGTESRGAGDAAPEQAAAIGDERTGQIAAGMQAVRVHGGRPGLLLSLEDAGAPPAGTLPLAYRIVVDLRDGEPVDDDLVFRMKTRLTELRAARPDVVLGVRAPRDSIRALLKQDLGPYVDFIAVPAERAPYPADRLGTRVSALSAPSERALSTPAAGRWLVELPEDALDARNALIDVARAGPFLGPGLIAGGTTDVLCGSAPAESYLDPESLETVAVARACGERTVTVSPTAPGVERVTLSTGDVIVRVAAAEGRYAEGVQVVGARQLSVREIVARHQAAAARQQRIVRELISAGTMTLTFEAPGFPAPIAITSHAVIYAAPERTEIEQRDVRVNGIAFSAGGIPRLPLLEPERVASPPLTITLGEVYRYTLEGEERIDGLRCYVVAFEPNDRTRTLFEGRAWIAADTFAMVKVSAVQTGLRGPIVSSHQADEFTRHGEVWLLRRSEVRQIYEGAGHRTPIHRVLTLERHEVNPADFAARRAAAYASPSIMLRDTPEGFRYLRRESASDGSPVREPVVTERATRVRTLALGVIVDPNISTPLPFAGLSYVDFDLFGTGTQLNGFFGGTYGQLAVSVPSIGGTRWQLAGRAFGIASSYNDRAFVLGREIYRANISQRPAHASVWLLRPLTPRFTARAGYDFDYTHYGATDSTSSTFAVPAPQAAHALRLTLEGQAAGWTAAFWWAGARRAGWRPWGERGSPADGVVVEGYRPGEEEYQRVGATVARSFVASPRLVGKVEAAWMSGRDLDRFSRYTFGSFDNRLRGYPSALIRYDRGAVVRGAAAWAAGRLLRIDGFLDTAYVHDPGFGARSKSYTGVGAAAEVPALFGTLVAIEWGYGFQGINSDGRRGTHVIRISGYKMF